MVKLALASILALFMGLSLGATANAWPNFDILPDPNLEDLNDFPDLDSDPNLYDEGREVLDESRKVADWDFNDDGVMDEAEWGYAFERDVDEDGVLDYQDPDQSEINYMLRLPGGYDYDNDGLFDDDAKDHVYGKDRVPDPDPDPDPDPELQYQYQETTVQETTVQEETTVAEETTATEETTPEETTRNPDDAGSNDEGVSWGGVFVAAAVFGIWVLFRER